MVQLEGIVPRTIQCTPTANQDSILHWNVVSATRQYVLFYAIPEQQRVLLFLGEFACRVLLHIPYPIWP